MDDEILAIAKSPSASLDIYISYILLLFSRLELAVLAPTSGSSRVNISVPM